LAVLPHEGTYSILYGRVSVPVGSGYRSGYLSRPDAAGRFPTVILIPGSRGLASFERDLCRRLARWGLACLALDVYPGDPDPLAAYQVRTDKEIQADLDETFEYIQSDDVFWAITEPLGLLGLDVGGRAALIAGAYRPWVGACGVVSTPLTGDEGRDFQVAGLLSSLPVPVLGLYGAADDLISPETIDEAQTRNSSGLWLLYAEAGHDFFDDDAPAFEPGAAADAFVRIRDLFRQALPPAIEEDLG
jgi:carboxymethylenebutenolidase